MARLRLGGSAHLAARKTQGGYSSSMKLAGILLIGNSLVLTAYWVTAVGTHKTAVISICLIAIFAGVVLTFHERIILYFPLTWKARKFGSYYI